MSDPKSKYYRNVFSTAEGRLVLTDILSDLGHFSVCDSESDRALQNYAKTLLAKVGMWDIHNIGKIVNAYVGIPTYEEKSDGNRSEGGRR